MDDAVFRIRIDAEATDGDPYATGRIEAPDMRESFRAPLGRWRIDDYLASWRDELERLKTGASRAVLLTLAAEPADVNFLRGFLLYRQGDEIAVQESMLFVDELPRDFSLSSPSSAAPAYESETEDGHPISEWRFPVADLDVDAAVGRYGR